MNKRDHQRAYRKVRLEIWRLRLELAWLRIRRAF
jgi:hypothetical protein